MNWLKRFIQQDEEPDLKRNLGCKFCKYSFIEKPYKHIELMQCKLSEHYWYNWHSGKYASYYYCKTLNNNCCCQDWEAKND